MRIKNHPKSARERHARNEPRCGLTLTFDFQRFWLLGLIAVLLQVVVLAIMVHYTNHDRMILDIAVHSDVHNSAFPPSGVWKMKSSPQIGGHKARSNPIGSANTKTTAPQSAFLLRKEAHTSAFDSGTTNDRNNQIIHPTTGSRLPTAVDIIAIGSFTRARRLQTQRSIYTHHPAVRSFFDITEYNDTESTCHTNLTTKEVEAVVDHCKQKGRRALGLDVSHPMLYHLSDLFYDLPSMTQQYSRSGTGWLCAQKRPVDGLVKVLRGYNNNNNNNSNNTAGATFPDYLILMDDDTYVNMDRLMPHFTTSIKDGNEVPRIIAGCRYNFGTELFPIAWGGFSTMFNRRAIQNLMTPIVCNDAAGATVRNLFNQNACDKLAQDQIGEGVLFVDGMSVLDLLDRYTFDQAYLEVSTGSSWNKIGSCFHSDWLISYFVSAYRIAPTNEPNNGTIGSCSLEPFKNTSHMTWHYRSGECIHNGRNNCRTGSATICHGLGSRGFMEVQRKMQDV